MKQLRFTEFLLTSLKEKKAKRILFDPHLTIIDGANDTGKSSLLKSIYRCFGAIPPRIHTRWKSSNIKALMKFSIDDVDYSILQDGDTYTVFDMNMNILKRCSSVTQELAPFLADLLDFRLQLISQQNDTMTPPPAYLFLPFYIDQDEGWNSNWSSFTRLQQFKDWRSDLVDYHLGIKPNDFYVAKGELAKLEMSVKEPLNRYNALKGILANLKLRLNHVSFSFDINDYQDQVRRLLVECTVLQRKEEELKDIMVPLYNRQASLSAQVEITKHAMSEIAKDYKYVVEQIADDEIECPTCGTKHKNSFAEHFAIANDQDRCHELLNEVTKELLAVTSDIATKAQHHASIKEDLEKINSILAEKQGALRLKDIIDAEGHRQVREIVEIDIEILMRTITEIDHAIEKAKRNIKQFDNKDHRKQITAEYAALMKAFLHQLEVHNIEEKTYSRIACKIEETGSDQPRALLAYYMSFLNIMLKHSSSPYCPIIIDAPNQQDQDVENVKKMLVLIRDRQPPNSQLILGLVEDFGVELPGKRITLSSKDNLLQEDEYDNVMDEFRPILDKSMKVVLG